MKVFVFILLIISMVSCKKETITSDLPKFCWECTQNILITDSLDQVKYSFAIIDTVRKSNDEINNYQINNSRLSYIFINGSRYYENNTITCKLSDKCKISRLK